MKKIKASQKSIAAGRDVNFILRIENNQIDFDGLLSTLHKLTGLPKQKLLERFGVRSLKSIPLSQLETTLQNLLLETKLSTETADNYQNFGQSADALISELQSISELSQSVHRHLKDYEFYAAFLSLGKMLESEVIPKQQKQKLLIDYLQTGYLHFANNGQTHELLNLVQNVRADDLSDGNIDIALLLAEIEQEIATRSLDIELLRENLAQLVLIEKKCSQNPELLFRVKILAGLCLRRLGERGDVELLEGSIQTLREALDASPNRFIETSNNLAISLIRFYELTGTKDALEEAKDLLSALNLPPSGNVMLNEYVSFPKSLNNLGNVFKQQISITNNDEFYLKAIEQYFKAEQFWNEKDAPYEWAMLQKNKAESRLIRIECFGFEEEAYKTALNEINDSLKYRTKSASPFQYKSSMAVKKRLELLQTQ